jgi:hypothetical protein
MDGSFMEMVAEGIVRKKLNNVFDEDNVNPDNLVTAIQNNVSLWECGEDEIKRQVDSVPGFILSMADEYVETVEKKYGGFTKLTLSFLKEDHPELYSIIINTDNGIMWLDRQVNEILRGIGIKQ